MTKYTTIETDIVTHVAKNGGVLLHQVNCQRKAAKGLAGQIADKWPNWKAAFVETTPHLGWSDIYQPQPNPRVWIVSLYAQDRYGTTGVHTDLDAFEWALKHFAKTLPGAMIGIREPMPLYVPYEIGCGLGGEKWENILPLLVAYMPGPFTICKLPKTR